MNYLTKIFKKFPPEHIKRYNEYRFEISERIIILMNRTGLSKHDINCAMKNNYNIDELIGAHREATLKELAKLESIFGEKIIEVL